MSRLQLSGTGVALVTPFTASGSIDYPALGRVIDHVIAGGVDFVVSLGTTGEAVTLTPTERNEVLDFTVRHVDERVPIIAGFGGSNTYALCERVASYHFNGIAGILSSSPSYNKPTQEGIYRHYMRLAEVAPRPIVIYNVPSRTASNVTAETTLRLAEASDRFCAVKEAAPDLHQIAQIAKHKPEGFQLLSGDDTLTLHLLASGGDGVISVIANALPEPFTAMVRAALANDFASATRYHLDLLDIHQWLYIDGNPAGIKHALYELGVCEAHVRLPLAPLRDKYHRELRESIKAWL